MLIRPAGEADLESLVRLRATWRGHDTTPEFRDAFTAWFQREGATRWWWLAADDDVGAVGMANLKVYDRMPSPAAPASRWGYLGNLFVLPEHRGRGIGGRLVEALVSRASAEGLVRVVLSPSTASVPLYERLGFRSAHGLLVRTLGD